MTRFGPLRLLQWKRFAEDSYSLCGEFYRGYKPSISSGGVTSSGTRLPTSVLLSQQAQADNLAAKSLLTAYKEINLIKYKGVHQYVQDYYYSRRASIVASDEGVKVKGSETGAAIQDDNKRAKVAFMITSAQRLLLREELGVEESVIKKLTPTQALLVIENRLLYTSETNENFMEKLNGLTKKNEEMMKLEKDKVMQENQNSANKKNPMHEQGGDENIEDFGESGLPNNECEQGPPSILSQEKITNISIDVNASWYEVVKRRKTENGEETEVVGLYKTSEEAQDCCEWKRTRSIVDSDSSSKNTSSFEVRSR